MSTFDVCSYFGFVFNTYCLSLVPYHNKPEDADFQIAHQWTHINFTWPSNAEYAKALANGKYIPENNVIAGIKVYGNKMYYALPRLRRGAPVTLAYSELAPPEHYYTNQLLTPYPTWEMNAKKDCVTLQNVQSMEIDTAGVMWVLDGNRFNNFTRCPPKLVLLDLNKFGSVVRIFEFPNEIVLRDGGFLNDLVIDETDGGYAYITDNSNIDPGIIVYSKQQNKAWKLRDKSMFGDNEAADFIVDGVANNNLIPVDGIALSPFPKLPNKDRLLYYSSITSFNLYSINNVILKNEELHKNGQWRRFVKNVGIKNGQSDGLIMDNQGNMYYGLLNLYGIGKWNINTPFTTSATIYQNRKTVIWPDSFAFDNNGYLYVINNGIHKFFNPDYPLSVTNEIKLRVLRLQTGTKSYLFK